MNDFYYNAFDTAEEFTLDVIALVFAGYKFTAEDLESLDSLSLINAKETLQIERKSLEFANNMYHAIYTDIKNNRLKIDDVDKSSNLHGDQLIHLTREEIKNWSKSKEFECPELLLPRDKNDVYKDADQRIKNNVEQARSKQETSSHNSNSNTQLNYNTQIKSPTYKKLIQAIEKFPKQFPDYASKPTLKGEGKKKEGVTTVAGWLVTEFNLTSRFAWAFATILKEHFCYSSEKNIENNQT